MTDLCNVRIHSDGRCQSLKAPKYVYVVLGDTVG